MADKTLRTVAEELADSFYTGAAIYKPSVIDAIIAGMRVALAEPSADMLVVGCPFPDDTGAPYCYDREVIEEAFCAMAAKRLEGLK